jgi:glucose/arabinose dehydrogenase
MRFRQTLSLALALALLVLAPAGAAAQLRPEPFVSGLTHPVAFVQDPSNPAVQFVVQQEGLIRVISGGALQTTPFLNLATAIATGGERGLLGMAMAPDYATSGRFFVFFTAVTTGNLVVARFTRSAGNPLVADALSRLDLQWSTGERFIRHPTFANHNGGMLAFGPDDGYLYVGTGDGGGGNDPANNAQNTTSLLGKILRLDVGVPDSNTAGFVVPADNPFASSSAPEIWDIGLRNPWRFSFDDSSRGGTGALIIGDVGQNAWEEVDYEPAGEGGRNYGWRNREGAHDNVTTVAPAFLPLVDPIFEYSHAVGNAITGGYVYRGRRLGPSMRGRYVFADFGGKIWSIALTIDPVTGEAAASDLREHTAELRPGNVSAFGVDAAGELYWCSWSVGTIYRIGTTAPASVPFINIDTPPNGVSVTQPFLLAGWAVDAMAVEDPEIDAVHVWAHPLSPSGSPRFVGAATLGGSRPDVAQAFGGSQFEFSGFALTVSGLPAGRYRLVASALVRTTGTFDAVASADVDIRPTALVVLDQPAQLAVIAQPFPLAGWALDWSATTDPGIDAVHVWAYPLSPGGDPRFVGAATLGGSRPDVAQAFGGSQFESSGFNLTVRGLPPGTYRLVVAALVRATGTFDAVTTADVDIRPSVLVSVDAPANGSTVDSTFGIAGWAVDGASAEGPGIDTIHVWATRSDGQTVFFGATTAFFDRPDVGAAFGAQFTRSGFDVQGTLPGPGNWSLLVYARSVLDGQFRLATPVTITVR